jgi:hypothetical protein
MSAQAYYAIGRHTISIARWLLTPTAKIGNATLAIDGSRQIMLTGSWNIEYNVVDWKINVAVIRPASCAVIWVSFPQEED